MDLDADGFLDLAAASGRAQDRSGGRGRREVRDDPRAPAPHDLRSLAPGDFDGDGKPDLAAAAAGSILVYLGSEAGLSCRREP
jgi:hypothetical protein